MTYDVCIVGSGASGGAVAYMLAKAGLKTLILEKGPAMKREDFSKDEIACCRRDIYTPNLFEEFHTLEEYDGNSWSETPTHETGRSFWNGSMLGGSSNVMSGFFHRMKPDDFRLLSKYGAVDGANVVDWPISYEELEPWYAMVERVVGVSGTADKVPYAEWRSTPDFPYPPTQEHPIVKLFDESCTRIGYHSMRTPRAVLPEAKGHRDGCYYSNYCGSYGCSSGAKGSSREALITPALATGNLTVKTGAHVKRLLTDASGRVTEAEYVNGGFVHRVKAKLFVVAAQAIETSRLLLNSANEYYPKGLANSSGELGKNLIFSGGGTGQGTFWRDSLKKITFEELMERGLFVNRALQDWYEVELPGKGKVKGGLIEFLFEHANPINRAVSLKYEGNDLIWGEALQQKVERYFRHSKSLNFEIFCDWLPTDDTYVTIDKKRRDKYGMPVAKLRIGPHPQDLEVAAVIAEKAERLFEVMGAKEISSSLSSAPPPNLVAGGCRFGDDPKTSVLDRYCKAHDVLNLFVADASFMPTGGSVPYTWTIYANALRVGDYIARNFSSIVRPV